jgi:hypothetical protein
VIKLLLLLLSGAKVGVPLLVAIRTHALVSPAAS